jgi:predicted enzyme related to lactoylglutathione lyase
VVQAEVDRLVGLGATVVREPNEEYGTYRATLQDPDGNEPCAAPRSGLGAKRLSDKEEWGHRWTVLTDPEGNEFCVA